MNSTTPEQIVAVQKAGVDTTFDLLNKTVNAIEKLTGLTLQAAKSGLAENQEALVTALGAGAPHTFVAHQAARYNLRSKRHSHIGARFTKLLRAVERNFWRLPKRS